MAGACSGTGGTQDTREEPTMPSATTPPFATRSAGLAHYLCAARNGSGAIRRPAVTHGLGPQRRHRPHGGHTAMLPRIGAQERP